MFPTDFAHSLLSFMNLFIPGLQKKPCFAQLYVSSMIYSVPYFATESGVVPNSAGSRLSPVTTNAIYMNTSYFVFVFQ